MKKNHFKSLIYLSLILLCLGCSNDSPTYPTTATINGMVVDYVTALPLPNTFISTSNPSEATMTDSFGKFTISTYNSGSYAITASKAGYIDNTINIDVELGKTTNAVIPLNKIDTSGTNPTNDTYTKLLLHFNNNFNDSETGGSAKIVANKIVTFSNSFYKFGGYSGHFYGTGVETSPMNGLIVPQSPDFDFGSGDFTIDFWLKRSQNTNRDYIIGNYNVSDGTKGGWAMCILGSSENNAYSCLAQFYVADYTTVQLVGGNLNNTNWHHIALVRNGSAWILFVDGTVANTVNDSRSIINANYDLFIGDNRKDASGNGRGGIIGGYLDELRISKGIARWTSAFTPPSIEY